jgi:enoyl-CoA hydratase/carnithine racemase
MNTPITTQLADTAEDLVLSREGMVATVTINRPQRGNTWLPTMNQQLEDMLKLLGQDDSVRVIVLTGEGKNFCTGGDLGNLNTLNSNSFPELRREPSDDDFAQRFSYMLAIPKPIIGAINGSAIGLGLAIAMYCDVRWASDQAKISAMFSRRGMVADHGLAWLMPRLMGLSRAFEFLVGGATLNAQEAERQGVVNLVLPNDSFREEVARRAADWAANISPRSARIMKRQIYDATRSTLAQATQISEREGRACFDSADFREAISSLMEKRAPNFTGQ